MISCMHARRYNAAVFGFSHFGKLVGLGLCIASTFSLLMYPLLGVTLQQLAGDFTAVNSLFAVLTAVAPLLAVNRLNRAGKQAHHAASTASTSSTCSTGVAVAAETKSDTP